MDKNSQKPPLSNFIVSGPEYVSTDIHRVLQTIQIKLILLCVWAEQVVWGSTKTALKFKYGI